MNIFTGLLSVEKMQSITNGTDCGMLGDFLAWDPSQWEPTQDFIRYFELDLKDFCFNFGTSRFIKFTHREQTDALNDCSKFGKANLPDVDSDKKIEEYFETVRLEELYFTLIRNKSRSTFQERFDHTILPYTYNSGTYTNLYDDTTFNYSTPKLFQRSIDYSLKTGTTSIVMSYRWDGFYKGKWQLYGLTTQLETTCITQEPLLFTLRNVFFHRL